MSKEISKQEKEDYLSLMYEMKRKENQIVKSDLSRELEVPLSRVTRVKVLFGFYRVSLLTLAIRN